MIKISKNIDKEIKKILDIAGVILTEDLNYDDLSQKVFNNVWTSGDIFDMLEWLLADYITNHSNEKIIQDLIKISNKTNSEELEEYIYTHPKDKICYEIIRNTFFEYFNYEKNKLVKELDKDNKIFRSIQSNHNLETLLKTIQKNGIGNCWAKEKNNAQSWNVSGDYKFDYIFESEFNEDMVDWEKTMYLRLFDPQEDEIRLKKDIDVNLLSVTQYPLPFDMYKSKETKRNLNMIVPVGSKYAY